LLFGIHLSCFLAKRVLEEKFVLLFYLLLSFGKEI